MVFFQIEQAGRSKFNACLNINPEPLKTVTKLAHFTQENLQTANLFTILSNGQPCKNVLTETITAADDVKLCYRISCAESTKHVLSFNFFDVLGPLFSVIGLYKDLSDENAFTLDAKKNRYDFESKEVNFFHLGIDHIGATMDAWKDEYGRFAIADGIDHVLFILMLVLVSSNWKSLLIHVTGFTVGHSITLGLALGGWILIPAKYIEPVIAATILYLALQAFRKTPKENHVLATLIFGLIHGMGFSYILGEIEFGSIQEFLKVLFLFNIGIETGQLILVLLFLPFFLMNQYSVAGRVHIQKGIAFVVCGLSLYWCYDRISALF